MPLKFRQKLLDFINSKIQTSGKTVNGELTDNTPLISSGLLESLHLLELAMLIEEEIGSSLDITNIDFASDWNTIDSILSYAANNRK